MIKKVFSHINISTLRIMVEKQIWQFRVTNCISCKLSFYKSIWWHASDNFYARNFFTLNCKLFFFNLKILQSIICIIHISYNIFNFINKNGSCNMFVVWKLLGFFVYSFGPSHSKYVKKTRIRKTVARSCVWPHWLPSEKWLWFIACIGTSARLHKSLYFR